MSKNEVIYTPWGSLSGKKSGKQALRKKKGKQMLTDKNLLILTGRHQCACAGVRMRIWLSCFPSVGWQDISELKALDQKMKCILPLRLATHIPFIQLSCTQDGQEPRGLENMNLSSSPGKSIFPRPRLTKERT